ncbi:MAG: hypothetical protein HQL45_14085 [Alphaproteobacteria bacterium]|nr:hypothetical protein [Alphaproteobacteria bacterium]MBF0354489.1 hypothetical protein [Alphaproteobacteria bacterium]
MPHLARRSTAFPHPSVQVCAWGPRSVGADGLRYCGNDEPSLTELLSDPMVARLIASDGVAHEELARLVGRAQESLKA